MFNHRIIFRFFSLVFIAGIFFGFSNVLGVCTIGTDGSYNGGSMIGPSDSRIPGGCRSYEENQSSINRYDNRQSLSDNAKKFIVAYNLGNTFNLNCSHSYVSTIQSKMQNIGGSCSTCNDGKFGRDTKNKLNNNCLPTCASPKQPVNADLQNPCNNNYILDNGCCKVDCSEGEKLEQNSVGLCDDPGFIPDGAGCCIPDCQNPKKPVTAPNCSDLPGYMYENGCCIPSTPGNPSSIQQRETDCSLTTGSLNDTTVSCVNRRSGNSCCADTTCRPTGEPRPSNLPDCDMNVVDRENNCGLTPGILDNITVSCINLQGNSCCVDTGCRPTGQPKPGLVDCSAETLNPNTCTADGQIGSLSGTSRNCTSCGSGTIANSDHTKCVCDSTQKCCGIQLNTVVPFIGDCIEMSSDESAGNTTRVNALNAFPILMGSLSKMLVTAILIFSFVMVVVGGVLITAGGINPDNFKKGKDIIGKVIVGLALLGASGIILRLINPNFFG